MASCQAADARAVGPSAWPRALAGAQWGLRRSWRGRGTGAGWVGAGGCHGLLFVMS